MKFSYVFNSPHIAFVPERKRNVILTFHVSGLEVPMKGRLEVKKIASSSSAWEGAAGMQFIFEFSLDALKKAMGVESDLELLRLLAQAEEEYSKGTQVRD